MKYEKIPIDEVKHIENVFLLDNKKSAVVCVGIGCCLDRKDFNGRQRALVTLKTILSWKLKAVRLVISLKLYTQNLLMPVITKYFPLQY